MLRQTANSVLIFLVIAVSNICVANQAQPNIINLPKAGTLGIILLGDSGTGEPAQMQVANAIYRYCQQELCSFGLLLGDNIYRSGVDNIADPQFKIKFEQAYKDLKFKFYPVLGNHDARGNWQAEVDYNSQHWQMAGRYYSINAQLAKFFALDTNLMLELYADPANPIAKSQEQWLAKNLKSAKTGWKIVYGHHPVLSSGLHGDTEALKEFVQPLLEANKVDFYIAGHDHDKELITSNGVNYIICGTGASTRSVWPEKDTRFANATLGFAHLLLTSKNATLKFVNVDGKVDYSAEFSKAEFSK